MAERINVAAFRNQVVYGMQPPIWQEWRRAPEAVRNAWNHPFATRVRSGVADAGRTWVNNINPANIIREDWWWRMGMGIGLTESAAVIFITPIGGGVIKGLANAAIIHGVTFAAERYNPTWTPRIRNIARGISAGSTYGGLVFGLGEDLFNRFLGDFSVAAPSPDSGPGDQPTDKGVSPEPTSPQQPEGSGGSVPKPEPPAPPRWPGGNPIFSGQPDGVQPEPVNPDLNSITDKVRALNESNALKEDLVAQVGQHLPIQDSVINSVLETQGLSRTRVPDSVLSTARETVKKALENQANIFASQVTTEIINANPNMDPTSAQAVEMAKQTTRDKLDAWMQNPKNVADIAGVTQMTINEQLSQHLVKTTENVTKFIAENKDNSNLFTEHVVQRGETAGHMVADMGFKVTWDGTDYEGFVALWAANPEVFTDIRTSMGLSQQQFVELVQRIRAGDQDAYKQLIQHMSLVKAGVKLRFLTPDGVKKLLELVK